MTTFNIEFQGVNVGSAEAKDLEALCANLDLKQQGTSEATITLKNHKGEDIWHQLIIKPVQLIQSKEELDKIVLWTIADLSPR